MQTLIAAGLGQRPKCRRLLSAVSLLGGLLTLAMTACGSVGGGYGGTYNGSATLSAGTPNSIASSIVITNSTSGASMTVRWNSSATLTCTFDATIPADGSSPATIAVGSQCSFPMMGGNATVQWVSGTVTHTDPTIALALDSRVVAAPTGSGLTAGGDLMISFTGIVM